MVGGIVRECIDKGRNFIPVLVTWAAPLLALMRQRNTLAWCEREGGGGERRWSWYPLMKPITLYYVVCRWLLDSLIANQGDPHALGQVFTTSVSHNGKLVWCPTVIECLSRGHVSYRCSGSCDLHVQVTCSNILQNSGLIALPSVLT